MTTGDIAAETNPAPARRAVPLRAATRSAVILIFLLSLTLPVIFFIGPLRLSAYRLVLLVMFIPLVVRWLSGKYGGIKAPDILLFLFCAWAGIGLVLLHGVGRTYEGIGILFAETFGAYLLGRIAIRTPQTFAYFVKILCIVVLLLAPFAIIEALTGRIPISEFLAQFMVVHAREDLELRWGMRRAQVVFEHPILYGVFCSAAFALSIYVLGWTRRGMARLFWPVIAVVATFFSLSVGAFMSIIVQAGFIAWDRSMRWFRRRWLLLSILFAIVYVVVDLLSNRTPIHVFISYLTFSHWNSYIRVLIWDYGSAEALRHPVFGMGLNAHTWARPHWLPPSIDNFWLVITLRHGFPALAFLATCWALIITRTARAKISDPAVLAARKGFLITVGGICLSISTVHLWNGTYAFLMFLFGSGVWIADWTGTSDAPADTAPPDTKDAARTRGRPAQSRYTRQTRDPDQSGIRPPGRPRRRQAGK